MVKNESPRNSSRNGVGGGRKKEKKTASLKQRVGERKGGKKWEETQRTPDDNAWRTDVTPQVRRCAAKCQ